MKQGKHTSFIAEKFILKHFRLLLSAFFLFHLAGNVQAEGWSITKILTVHHVGRPCDNDGFRPESFLFEKEINERDRLSFGVIENSEGRTGASVGYSRDFHQTPKWDLFGKVQVASNYKTKAATAGITPIPLFGVRYHISKNMNVMLEGLPIPNQDRPFALVVLSVNMDL